MGVDASDEEAIREDTTARNAEKSPKLAIRSTRGNWEQSELSLEPAARLDEEASNGLNSVAAKIVSYLKARRSWLSKSDILAYVDIPDGHWNAAITDLLASGIVERQGERRGTRYRISESD